MDAINPLAVVAASVAVFIASSIYYMLLASRAARYSAAFADAASTPAWKVAQEPVRAFVTAAVVAGVVGVGGIEDVGGGLLLAGALWIGFPAMLLAGSVIHENAPWQLASIHAGDWLMKLIIIAAIVTVWS